MAGTASSERSYLPPEPALILRQPPARLLATMCRNIASSAGSLIVSPSRKATVRAVLLSWPAVMIPSGSGVARDVCLTSVEQLRDRHGSPHLATLPALGEMGSASA